VTVLVRVFWKFTKVGERCAMQYEIRVVKTGLELHVMTIGCFWLYLCHLCEQ